MAKHFRKFYRFAIVVLLISFFFKLSYAERISKNRINGFDSFSESIESDHLKINVNGDLDHFLKYTSLNNPEIKSAYYNVISALEKVDYVGGFPDPIFSVGYFLENVETRVGPQNKKFGIKQMIPWFGTLGTKKNIAYSNAQVSYQKFQAIKFGVLYKLKKAYYEYYFLGREILITNENLELLKFWESVTRTKYKLALSQHSDLIKVQLELGQLEDKLLTLKDKQLSVQTRIKTIMNLPDSINIPVPVIVDISEKSLSKELVLKQITENNPELLSLVNLIEKEKYSVSLAGKQSYPNFNIGLDYIETGEAIDPSMTESGKDPFILSFGINVPLWFGKNKAKKNEAKARLNWADNKFISKQNDLRYFTEHLLFEYNDNLRKVQLYRDGLIPKAKQLLNATYTSYQANKTDFLNLLDAQRQLLKLQIEYDRSIVNLAITNAQLEMLSGQTLNL